jgi:hypothetical protein
VILTEERKKEILNFIEKVWKELFFFKEKDIIEMLFYCFNIKKW